MPPAPERRPGLFVVDLATKLGFTEVGRFEAWDVEQWFGERSRVTPSA